MYFTRSDLHLCYTCATPWEPVDKLRIMQMTRLSDERKSRGLTFGAPSSRLSHFDEEKVEIPVACVLNGNNYAINCFS